MPRMKPSTALRKRMDAALAPGMEWSEQEIELLTFAGRAADRAEIIQAQLDRELSREEPRPMNVVRLSAELRALEKVQADMVSRLNPTAEGPAKSQRHVTAALVRWDREKERHG